MTFKIEKEESLNKTIRLPRSLIKQLEKLASDQNISFNKLVIQCCQYALKNLDEGKGQGRI